MSDKFKVGQPVWAISVNGVWDFGTVTEARRTREVRCLTDGRYYVLPVYIVDIAEKSEYQNGFAYEEHQLRPRDEGQFTPADESWNWRLTPREIA